MLKLVKRLVKEEDGMEMVEWSIVAVIFALAAALVWNSLKEDINTALTNVGDCVEDSTNCPGLGGS